MSTLSRSEERLVAIETKLDMLLSIAMQARNTVAPEAVPPKTGIQVKAETVFRTLTPKQHATVQMLLDGGTDEAISRRFEVSINTAKVYVRSIARRLGVQRRGEIVRLLGPLFDATDDTMYLAFSSGLPKNWHRTWHEGNPYEAMLRRRE